MNDYDRAEFEAEMAAERAQYVGQECECGEIIETPRVFQAPDVFGRPYEAVACSEECEREIKYPPRHVGEDFRADWDGYYEEEPEWDDRTGERIW